MRAGTDYVDITGEPDFVDRMIERYGDEAREKALSSTNRAPEAP